MLAMVASREGEIENPGPDDIYRVGVAGTVARMIKVPDGTLRILVHGSQRVQIGEFVQSEPYMAAKVTELPDLIEPSSELEALFRNVQTTFSRIIEEVPYLPEELQLAVTNLEDPAELAHMIAGALRIKTEERQELLEELDVAKRLRRLSELLARELELISIGSKIQSQVESEIDKGQREFFLRQQLKAIQEELGEVDEIEAESQELREQIEAAGLPEHAMKQAERELQRFERLPPQSAEHGVIRGYLEWLASLPWSVSTEDHLDLKKARRVLDRDHYDMEKVKDRILEFLAVRKLKPDARSSILCFVGPPGVGKTSLGKSIAAAMGREFERISVGGVRDESEIRGHRRTYIGAMPGTIIRAMRDAGVQQPGVDDRRDRQDGHGLPRRSVQRHARGARPRAELVASATTTSTSPFDLSKVLFITTANQLDPVPAPLRDRMEMIELAGYTEEEKLEIAKRYLVPRQVEQNGLGKSKIEFTDEALREVIEGYTREAGVRNLEREIGAICRKVAREFAEGKRKSKRTIRPKARGRAARQAPLPARRGPADGRARRGHRPGVDSGGRRRAVRGGHLVPRRGEAAGDGPAGRRDEGIGAGGALVREAQRGQARRRGARELVPGERRAPPRAGRARSPRTARARGSPWPPRCPRWSAAAP